LQNYKLKTYILRLKMHVLGLKMHVFRVKNACFRVKNACFRAKNACLRAKNAHFYLKCVFCNGNCNQIFGYKLSQNDYFAKIKIRL